VAPAVAGIGLIAVGGAIAAVDASFGR